MYPHAHDKFSAIPRASLATVYNNYDVTSYVSSKQILLHVHNQTFSIFRLIK